MIHGAAIIGVVLGCVIAESTAGYGLYPVEGYQEEFTNDGTYTREERGKDAVQFAKGYKTGHEEKDKEQQEGGYYSGVTADHAQYGDGEKSVHDSYYGQTGKTEETMRNKAGHNKGFSTTGYQDFHHKDEVGKKTTFYDSSDNAGGRYDFKASEDVYGNKGEQGVHKNVNDGKYKEMTRGSKGSYGHDDTLEHKKYKNEMYERKGYSDNDYSNDENVYTKEHKGKQKPMFHPQMMKKPYPGFPGGFPGRHYPEQPFGSYPEPHLPHPPHPSFRRYPEPHPPHPPFHH